MKTALPSNRSFGWTFTGVFVVFGDELLLEPQPVVPGGQER
jgi:hypothetical protein